MAAKRTVRVERTSATRDRIGTAALELFSEQGYTAMTIDQIAESAAIRRRTFFRYVPTNDAVLFSEFLARQQVELGQIRVGPLHELPLVSLLAVVPILCEQPLDSGGRQQIRRTLQQSPELTGIERRLAVYDFEEALVRDLRRSWW